VILDSFGDNSIKFLVRVWTQDFSQRPGMMRHKINMAIWEALHEEKIEIPFPQLDLHVRSSPQGADAKPI
jgi:small-conductance mechanosensitive channel